MPEGRPGEHEAQPDPAGGPARSAGADAVRLALGSRAAAREGLRQHPAVADRPEPGRRLRRTARQREVTQWRALQRAFATASSPRKRGSSDSGSATQHRLHAITGITRLIGSTQAASTRVDAAFFLRHSAAHRVEEAMDSPFRAVLSPCIGVCTMAEDGYRSEEHTYELQSLMRTS